MDELLTEEIKTNSIRYYRDRINEVISDYKHFLSEDEEKADAMLTRPNTFNSMMVYIGSNIFSDNILYNKDYNIPCNNITIINNIDLLKALLDIYSMLCGKYNNKISVISFCSMVNINKKELLDSSNQNTNPKICSFVRRLKELMEQSHISSGQTFDLFILKSKFGYRDDVWAVPLEVDGIASLPDLYNRYTLPVPES